MGPVNPNLPKRKDRATLALAPCSRRRFIKGVAGGAAALGPMNVLLQSAYAVEATRYLSGARTRKRGPAAPLDAELLALVNRTSFGFSKTQYDVAAAMGYEAYLEWQLDYAAIPDPVVDARLTAYPSLTMTSQQILNTYDTPESQAIPILELMSASVERAVYTQRQLYERMVEFWTDHFSIYMGGNITRFLKTADDRDVIRQNAMTTFPQLLHASAHSPAMLFYLDNYTNIVGHAQENYARELMELHTLGVTGPYTQQDVEEVARCLTGWTIMDSPNFGEFAFWPPFHDTGSKIVLGQVIPAGGGESDGLTVLDILANHPNTARFIARKLCVRFLGYNPPEDIVESVTAIYLATGGDIKEMLRFILQRPILISRATTKLKRPFHLLASMVRAADADAVIGSAPDYYYLSMLQFMGHLPFWWEPPNGYPDSLEAWADGQLPRWQTASYFFDGALGATMDLNGLLQAEGGNLPGEQAAAIDRILTGGVMSADEVAGIQQFYDAQSPGDPFTLSDAFGLAASSPGSQWY